MTVLMDTQNGFAEHFERAAAHAREWVNALRARGMETFDRLGFPTTRQEEWRDTNIAPIVRTRFAWAVETPAADARARELVQQYSLGREAIAELVFINGRFHPRASRLADLPPGVRVMSLASALEAEPDLVEAHIGRHAKIEEHPFAALNSAFIADGAVVLLDHGASCPRPIHLLFLSIPSSDEPTVSHPRVLVVAGERSNSSIVETYAGAPGAVYLANAVTEIVQARDSHIDHNKLQQESESAFHIALMQVQLDAGSAFISHSTSLGSRLTRNDLQVYLGGERAEATINGLVYARGDQHIDNHTLLHHEKAHCPSHELYKHVLADKATGVFKGKIFVQKDAQKTDSKQTSKSLLLSDDAFMNSQPALEIYADDVKCTHGSTIGPVDSNAVFYLVSRGLSLEQARHLMTYAFAADITRRIKVTAVRARIEDFMAAQHGLPQDLRITENAAHDVALL
jgi:Fe-S cluster assembly protein SufD